MKKKGDFQNQRRYGDVSTISEITGISRSYVQKVVLGTRKGRSTKAKKILETLKGLQNSRVQISITSLDQTNEGGTDAG